MTALLNTLANPFQFETLEVRTATDDNNEVWFCAKDVCAVLDISWRGKETLENLPENWQLVRSDRTSNGEKDTYFVNEAGLYKLIFRSDKPKAKEFANWICETVLPSIRKNGFFGILSLKDKIALGKEINALARQISTSKNLFEINLLVPQLQTYCNIAGLKMPALNLVKADIEQHDLFLEGAK